MAKKKTKIDTQAIKHDAFIEAMKLMLRLYIFSVAPLLLASLLSGINTATGELNIDWLVFRNIFLFQTITFIIAGIDKFKHEYAKAQDPVANEGKSLGIVKF